MTFYVPDDPAAILDMVARKAPLLMRAAGGALVQESCTQTRIQRDRKIVRMARSGKYRVTDIARALDTSAPWVCRVLKKHGVTMPKSKARKEAA